MKKFWLVFAYEYKRQVLRKRFIFAILSMPLMVAFMVGIGYLSVTLNSNPLPVGYVDPYQLLSNPKQVPEAPSSAMKQVEVIRYESETAARDALNRGEVQAYYVVSANYMSTGEVTMVNNDKVGSNASSSFGNFLKYNIASGLPETTVTRLIDGNNMIIRSQDGKRELDANNWISIVLPLLSGVLFFIAVNITGGYLLQAVVEEKENRTMEILVTSVSPTQLMGGKITGDLMVGLTELFVWILFAIFGLIIAPRFLPIDQTISIEPSFLLLLVATFLPAFIVTAGLMGTVGAMATESREAQQIAGLFTLPMIVPFWFITSIMFTPNGPIAVGMSLFPLTAPISLPMRAIFTDIPAWQIVVSIGLLWVLAVFSLWLAGRVFRIGMLQYGKRLSLHDVFHRAQEWPICLKHYLF